MKTIENDADSLRLNAEQRYAGALGRLRLRKRATTIRIAVLAIGLVVLLLALASRFRG